MQLLVNRAESFASETETGRRNRIEVLEDFEVEFDGESGERWWMCSSWCCCRDVKGVFDFLCLRQIELSKLMHTRRLLTCHRDFEVLAAVLCGTKALDALWGWFGGRGF